MENKDFDGAAHQLVCILESICSVALGDAQPIIRAALMSAAVRSMGEDHGADDDRARIDAAHENGAIEMREKIANWLDAWANKIATMRPIQSEVAKGFAESIRSQLASPEPFAVSQGACEKSLALFELATDNGIFRTKRAGGGYVVVAAVGHVSEDQMRFAIQDMVPSCKA